MKSRRGFAASVLFLMALPLAFVWQGAVGGGAEVVVHLVFGAGATLMALAVFDFRTARWIAWIGSVALRILAVIFLLQAAADLTNNDSFSNLAYRVLGQRLEAVAADLFIGWCIAA